MRIMSFSTTAHSILKSDEANADAKTGREESLTHRECHDVSISCGVLPSQSRDVLSTHGIAEPSFM